MSSTDLSTKLGQNTLSDDSTTEGGGTLDGCPVVDTLLITDLPTEILLKIFVKVNVRQLFSNVALACKTFYDLLYTQGIWKTILNLKKHDDLRNFRPQDDSDYVNSWRHVVCAYDDALGLRSLSQQRDKIKTVKLCQHFAPIDTVHIMPGSKLCVSGSRDRTLTIWDVDTKRAVHSLNAHKGWIWTVKSNEHRGNECVSSAWDHAVKLWDLNRAGAESEMLSNSFLYHSAAILSMSFDNHLIVTGSNDKKIRMFDPRANSIVRTISQHKRSVISLLEVSDEMILSGSEDKTIGVYDTRACKTVCNISVGTQALALSLAREHGFNYLRVAGLHGTLLIYSMNIDRFLLLNSYELWQEKKKVTSLANYHGCMVVGSEDGTVRYYSPGRQMKLLFANNMHTRTVAEIHVRDGIMATASADLSVGLTTVSEE